MNNIVACGYGGKVFPINPSRRYRGKKILGYKVFPSIDRVPHEVDLALIVVAGEYVKDTIEQCVAKNIEKAVIISSGFGECGEEGKKLESEIVAVAGKGNLRFVGPNAMGLWSAEASLNVSMGYISPTPGNVSIVSQSGSTGILLCSELRGMGVGVRRFVSSGNEASLIFEDYVECFLADEMTKVVGGFLEGLRDAGRFVDICSKNDENKPIIILKAGTTSAGARAALSHTASLSGTHDIYEAAFRQYGIVRADSIDAFLNLVRGFSYMKAPRGNRVAILAAAGGVGVLIADTCARAGLHVARPSQDLVDRISEHLPAFWSRSNPFDPTGVQDLSLFPRVLELILKSDEYDCVITHVIEIQSLLEKYFPRHDEGKRIKEMMMGTIASVERSVADEQIRIVKKYGKPVVFISHGYPNGELFKVFDEQKVVVVRTPDDAACVLKSLYEHGKHVV